MSYLSWIKRNDQLGRLKLAAQLPSASCRPSARSAFAGHPCRAERPGAARCAGNAAAPGTRRPGRPGTSCGKAALVGMGAPICLPQDG